MKRSNKNANKNETSNIEAINYYIDELAFLVNKYKKAVYNNSSELRFNDFNDFKKTAVEDLYEILEGIEYHKKEDFS